MLLERGRESIDGAEAFPSPKDSSKVIEVGRESPVHTLTRLKWPKIATGNVQMCSVKFVQRLIETALFRSTYPTV